MVTTSDLGAGYAAYQGAGAGVESAVDILTRWPTLKGRLLLVRRQGRIKVEIICLMSLTFSVWKTQRGRGRSHIFRSLGRRQDLRWSLLGDDWSAVDHDTEAHSKDAFSSRVQIITAESLPPSHAQAA
jgi:hypothetical protein